MDNTVISHKRASLITGAVLFAAALLFFATPIGHGDFWWHLETGQWIWENGRLPDEDPFSYTSGSSDEIKKTLVLKGYWLSQIAYFLSYRAFGLAGPILFNSVIFALSILVLWTILKRKGLGIFASFAISALTAIALRPFAEVRPHVFSFLGVLAIYGLSEEATEDFRKAPKPSLLVTLGAPAAMLAWANFHPGFLAGQGVIALVAVSESVKMLSRKNAMSGRRFLSYSLWSALCIGITYINPAGWRGAYVILLDYKSRMVSATISEYLAPWEYAHHIGEPFVIYTLAATLFVTFVLMAFSWSRLSLSHLLLYSVFAFAGLNSFRYQAFFILMSVAVSFSYAQAVSSKLSKRLNKASPALAAASLVLIVYLSASQSFINHGTLKNEAFPVRAAEFITSRGLPAPLFNPYEWSGYLIWKLYPCYKIFVDSRTMDFDAHIEYMRARMGLKDNAFDRHGINTVIFYPISYRTYNIPGIVFSLLKDDRWALVYLDEISVVFARKASVASSLVIDKDVLWNGLIRTAESWVDDPPPNSNPILLLSQIYTARGDREKALEYFRQAEPNKLGPR